MLSQSASITVWTRNDLRQAIKGYLQSLGKCQDQYHTSMEWIRRYQYGMVKLAWSSIVRSYWYGVV